MSFRRLAFGVLLAGAVPVLALAQSAESTPMSLSLELNAVQDVGGACRLTFLVNNETGMEIDKAVFETVIFDTSGGVVSLSLFNFRDLPAERLRVRQFEVPEIACDTVGKALINGANSCIVKGAESDICDKALSLSSRLAVELLG
ncbi:hypothetical protein [Sedimentitalea todarodis]|uniref:Tat pathway signal sequence domain protein n=1 Tax=Sedimentitalea todarodis TaxID=1631240 RepID=A0ABU3VFP8_9RHOB|nr:hypothetical protein [Sedimentitalea todarodis]MDU9004529.1 hypothetical protein [Sedimentitalea todarodis]